MNPSPRRVWKPIDLGGLRLYRVTVSFRIGSHYTRQNRAYTVAAKTPTDAARRVRECYEGREGDAHFHGEALNVLQPASWWDAGPPEPGDPRFGRE